MASYDSILETTAVRVIVDDANLRSRLNQVKQTASTTFRDLDRGQKQVASSARQQARAQDDVSESIKTGARLALTLRREYENDIITTREFKEQANALRATLLKQATQVERTSKSYDRAQLGAQRLSTALATVDGRTSKLGFSANVTTGVMGALNRRLVAAGPAGQSAAAGIASITSASRLARAGLTRLGTYISAQLIPIFATFAGIAGIGLLTRGLGNVVQTSFDAKIALRLFNREVEKSGQSIDAGADSLTRLAQRFRSTEDSVATGAVQLLRYGATLEQTERLLEAGGASALAFGRTASAGFEAVAQAIVGEQSQILNRIGIAGNLSTAYKRYADDLGTTSDALTRQQKVQAALNLILEETGGEIEALDEIMSGFGGALTQLRAEQRKTSIALGDEFRDELAQIIEAAGDFLRVFREQIVPFLGDTLGPAITRAAENVTAMSDALNGTADPFSRAGQAVTGFLTPIATLVAYTDIAIGNIERLGGRLNQFGATFLGPVEGALDSVGNRFIPQGLQDRLGFEQPSRGGGGGRGGSTDAELAAQRVQEGAARAQAGQELLDIIRSGDPNAIAAALFGPPVAPAAAPPPAPPLGPPGAEPPPGAPGGATGPTAGQRALDRARAASRGAGTALPPSVANLGSQVPPSIVAESARLMGERFAQDFILGLTTGGMSEGPATGMVALEWQDDRDRAIFDALFSTGRIGNTSEPSLTAGIALQSRNLQDQAIFDALSGEGGVTDRASVKPVALDWQTRQDEAIFNALFATGRLGETTEPLFREVGFLPTRAEQDAAIFNALGDYVPDIRGGTQYGNGARTFAPFVDTLTPREQEVRGSSIAVNQVGAFSEFFADVRQEQIQAATKFRDTVIQAGADFATTLADGIRTGDVGGTIEGLFGIAGQVGASFAGPYGPLVSAGAGILGSIFGGLFGGGSNESPAANSAQNRRNLSTLELNFTFNQQNELGLLNDPATTSRLAEFSDEAFRRFEEVIRRNINPRLDALEQRVGV